MEKYKYPRTPHVPSSPGRSSDDIQWDGTFLLGQEVVITEKMDGENTTIYPNGDSHARSLSSANHPSRDYIRRLAGQLSGVGMPEDMRLCGENLYARHSIGYDNLEDYFLLFSVWRGDVCLSWDETFEWASLLGLHTVPVLYRGLWEGDKDPAPWFHPTHTSEGWVVRKAGSFTRETFGQSIGKWVRKGHVQTDTHWMHQAVVPNKRKE